MWRFIIQKKLSKKSKMKSKQNKTNPNQKKKQKKNNKNSSLLWNNSDQLELRSDSWGKYGIYLNPPTKSYPIFIFPPRRSSLFHKFVPILHINHFHLGYTNVNPIWQFWNHVIFIYSSCCMVIALIHHNITTFWQFLSILIFYPFLTPKSCQNYQFRIR